MMLGSGYAIIVFAVVFWLLLSVKVLNEYERGVVFRLGKLPIPIDWMKALMGRDK